MPRKLFILFGATGDLSREKIWPALYASWKRDRTIFILGIARREFSHEEFRNFVRGELKDKEIAEQFLLSVEYTSGTFDDNNLYRNISSFLKEKHFDQTSVYLAVSPRFFTQIITAGRDAGIWSPEHQTHVLIEKPYAHNVKEFEELLETIDDCLQDKAYLVDHYLAKTPVEFFLDAHSRGEIMINPRSVTKIVVDLFEIEDVSKRGEYYDSVGAFVDVGANHMLQMLATLCVPEKDSKMLAQRRAEFIDSLCLNSSETQMYQYEGYTDTPHVDADSTKETAFRTVFRSNRPEWKHVNFILRGGKALAENKVEAHIMHEDEKLISLTLKPEECVLVKDGKNICTVRHNAYETLVQKSFEESPRLFVTRDEARAEWRVIDNLQKEKGSDTPEEYEKGTNPFMI